MNKQWVNFSSNCLQHLMAATAPVRWLQLLCVACHDLPWCPMMWCFLNCWCLPVCLCVCGCVCVCACLCAAQLQLEKDDGDKPIGSGAAHGRGNSALWRWSCSTEGGKRAEIPFGTSFQRFIMELTKCSAALSRDSRVPLLLRCPMPLWAEISWN